MAEDNNAMTQSSERFTDSIDAEKLTEGDRLDTKLVARTLGQLGQPVQSKGPDTVAVQMTQTNEMDDTHRALLFVPATKQWVRAGRHDRNSAWSQKEADWTVYSAGETITTTGGEVKSTPDEIGNEDEWVSGWVEIVFDELAYDARNGNTQPSVNDEVTLTGSTTLHLRDADGREAYAKFELDQ